jgi:hypothetical protein
MTVTADAITPWYRQAWPWFLISLPAIAVVGSLFTAVLAVRTYDGPVTADYYKQGLAINDEVARADLARDLGLQASVVVTGFADGDRIQVELSANRALPGDDALRLRLVHPGRPSEDRVAVLARVAADPERRSAVYVGSIEPLAVRGADAGRRALNGPVTWQVILEAPQWRIDDSFTAQTGGTFALQAR